MSKKRLAIVGTGSLGTIIGAYLNEAGYECDLFDTNVAHVKALNEKGATVVGYANKNVKVKAFTPDQMQGEYDYFFYIAKQTANPFALPQMAKHLKKDGCVVTLQNGLPEQAVMDVVGKDRVVGCPVGWGATWKEPGVAQLTTQIERAVFDIGEPNGKVTPRVEELKKMLESMCHTQIVTNLQGIRWTKVLLNVTISGINAVTGGTFGQDIADPKAMDIVARIAKECVQVGQASGVKFEPFGGKIYIAEASLWETEAEKQKVIATYDAAFGGKANPQKASMLQDLEKGLMTEIDAINGVVVAAGKKVGIPTPANQFVVDVVHGHQEKKTKPGFEFLDLFYKKYAK